MEAVNNPEDPGAGTRKVPFSKVLYIEQDDFRETPLPNIIVSSPAMKSVCVRLSDKMHACRQERQGRSRRGTLHL